MERSSEESSSSVGGGGSDSKLGEREPEPGVVANSRWWLWEGARWWWREECLLLVAKYMKDETLADKVKRRYTNDSCITARFYGCERPPPISAGNKQVRQRLTDPAKFRYSGTEFDKFSWRLVSTKIKVVGTGLSKIFTAFLIFSKTFHFGWLGATLQSIIFSILRALSHIDR